MQTGRQSRFALRSGDATRLRAMVRTNQGAASAARRARMVMLAAQGEPTARIAELVGISPPTVRLWLSRYARDGIAGLEDSPRPGRPARIDPHRVLESTFGSTTPPAPLTTRELGAALGISYATVARVWREHGVRPLRYGGWEIRTEPAFTIERARILGLFAGRREAAIVLESVDAPGSATAVPAPRGPRHPVPDWAASVQAIHAELELLLDRLATRERRAAHAPDLRSFTHQLRPVAAEHDVHLIVHRYERAHRALPTARSPSEALVHLHSVPAASAWTRLCLGTLHLAAQATRAGGEDPWWPDLHRALRVINRPPDGVDYFTWWRPRA